MVAAGRAYAYYDHTMAVPPWEGSLTAGTSPVTTARSPRSRRRFPAASGTEARRAVIAALLQIGDDGFNLSALTKCLAGCGVEVAVAETDTPGMVTVTFPGLIGEPPQWETVRAIIEDILPCHLQINHQFRYRTWGGVLTEGITWGQAAKTT